MPRSNRPRRGGRSTARPDGPAPMGLGGLQRVEAHPDGDWVVRRLTGAAAGKTYRCPGCSQEIAPGVPHLVAWPGHDLMGAQAALGDRRHWHESCWRARLTRR